jgi:hypothetical protein
MLLRQATEIGQFPSPLDLRKRDPVDLADGGELATLMDPTPRARTLSIIGTELGVRFEVVLSRRLSA